MRRPSAMLTHFTLPLLAIAVYSGWSGSVLAQAEPPRLQHFFQPNRDFLRTWRKTYASLAAETGARHELGLSPEQVQQVEKITAALEAKFKTEFENERKDFPEDDFTTRQNRIDRVADSIDAAGREQLAGVLTPTQAARLQQIHYQILGVARVLPRPEVGKFLSLTLTQSAEIQQVLDEQNASLQRKLDEFEGMRRTGNRPTDSLPGAAHDPEDLLSSQLSEEQLTLLDRNKAVPAGEVEGLLLSKLNDEQRGLIEELFGEKVDRDKLLYGPAGRPPGTSSPQEILRNQAK